MIFSCTSWFVAEISSNNNTTPAERNAYYLYTLVDFNMIGIASSLMVLKLTLSGQLEFDEFKSLLDEVWRWKDAFDFFDLDKSGSIDFQELQQALAMIGYLLLR